ncbi:hypothetical protein [Rossellomorea oryzaecorticis]
MCCPGQGQVYVVNFESNTLTIISEKTRKVIKTLKTGKGPEQKKEDP